jgi:hypothetical protein
LPLAKPAPVLDADKKVMSWPPVSGAYGFLVTDTAADKTVTVIRLGPRQLSLPVQAGHAYAVAARGEFSVSTAVAPDPGGGGGGGGDPVPVPSDTLALLQSDMANGAEALPNGFNGSWAQHPKSNTNTFRTGQHAFAMPWIALYQVRGGNKTAARAQMCDLTLHGQYDDGSWYRLWYDRDVTPPQQGNLFPENWINANGSVTPGGGAISAKAEQLADGSTAIRLGQGAPNAAGYLYHGWSSRRIDLRTGPKPISQLAHLVVTVGARIEPASYDPAAGYVLAVACDRWGPNGENGWEAMIGRFRVLRQGWGLVTATLGSITSAPQVAAPKLAEVHQLRAGLEHEPIYMPAQVGRAAA